MSIKIIALLKVKPECEQALLDLLALSAAAAKTESGILQYQVWREPAGARRFVFDEIYADQASLDAHRNSAQAQALIKALPDLWAEPPVAIFGDPVDV